MSKAVSEPKAPGRSERARLRTTAGNAPDRAGLRASAADRASARPGAAERASARLAAQLRALNDEQRQAATLPVGPTLVIAGAGSGKTRLLVARIVELVDSEAARPERILAITFARKTAAEMRERLAAALGADARRIGVSTMHAAALAMLRRHPDMAGLRRGFRVATEARSRALVAELLAEGGDPVPDELLNPAVSALARLKDDGLQPEDAAIEGWVAARGADQVTPSELAALGIYVRYQERLRAAGEADYGDLMLWPTLAMEADERRRQALADDFDHILVDEYQDTSALQDRWLTALARDHRSLWCVADDDQTIYAWRGAEVDNVLAFKARWPGATVARLTVNYRSTPAIVAASDALIAHNSRRLPKERRAAAEAPGDPITVVAAPTVEREACWHAEELARYLDADPARSAFVLYRANFLSRCIEEALIERGLGFAVVGDVAFYRRREVLDALAYLRLVTDRRDPEAFARIANVPARGLGDRARARIVAAAGPAGDLLEAAARTAGSGTLDRRGSAGAKQLADLAAGWSGSNASPRLGDRLFGVLLDAGYLDLLERDPDGRGAERRANVDELARVATLAGTAAALLERAERGAAAVDERARLTLMTIHAAKGLEADAVHLVGWQEGILPSRQALEREARQDHGGVEEERRLAYVALTRARSTAVISHCREGTQPRSRFIGEIPTRYRHEVRASMSRSSSGGPSDAEGAGGAMAPGVGDEPDADGRAAGARERCSPAYEPGEGELLPVEAGHRAVAAALLAAVDTAMAAGGDGRSWTMPWHDISARPTNPASGQAFRGSNVLVLWAAAARRGLVTREGSECAGARGVHFWASRKAWLALGGHIQPSAEPESILMPVYDDGRRRDHVRGHDHPIGADATDRKVPVLRGFRRWLVFNAADVAGARLPERGARSDVDLIATADTAVRAYLDDRGPALTHGGVAAVYQPRYDRVTMPPREAFSGSEGEPAAIPYYATLFHELAHNAAVRIMPHGADWRPNRGSLATRCSA